MTAVEWLVNELQVRLSIIKSEPDGFVRETMINNFLIDTEQAKEMEKQQAQEYAEFAIICNRQNMKVLEFDGYVKLKTIKK